MRKIVLTLAAGAAWGLCACASTSSNPGTQTANQIGGGAVNTATSSTSGAINGQVGNATAGFWRRVFGSH